MTFMTSVACPRPPWASLGSSWASQPASKVMLQYMALQYKKPSPDRPTPAAQAYIYTAALPLYTRGLSQF